MAELRRVGGGAWVAGILAAALLAACGDDAGAGSGGASGTAAPSGAERCEQPGFTETGCTCGGTGVGHRTCSADYAWSACSCRPRDPTCTQGEPVACACPGEDELRTTTCLAGGTFDCPCPATGDGNDAG